MALSQSIRAGAAYVELHTKDSKLIRGLDMAKRRLQSFGDSISSIGSRMLATGATLGLPFATAVGIFSKFSDKMAEVKAITGANESEFASLDAMAKKLGRTTSFSASQVAEGMKFLGMAGFTTEQTLASIPAVLDLARAGAVDLGLAADIVSDVGSAFGITADQTQRLADVMAKTATSANTSVAMMGESFKFVAPVARAAGQSIEETAAALGILGNSGIKASSAGTDIKNVLSRMASEAKDKLASIGVSATDSAGNMRPLLDVMRDLGKATEGMSQSDKLAFFMDTFGRISGKSAIILANAGEQIDQMRDKLLNADGAARKAAETMDDNLGGAFRSFMSSAEGAAIAVGEALAPALRQLTERLTTGVRMVTEFIANNRGLVLTMAKVIGGVIVVGAGLMAFGTALSAVGMAIGGVVSGVAALGTMISMAMTAVATILSPLGLLVIGTVSLGVALLYVSGIGAKHSIGSSPSSKI